LGRRHVLGGVRGVGPDGRGLSSTGGGHRVPSSGGGPCGRSATLGRSVFSARLTDCVARRGSRRTGITAHERTVPSSLSSITPGARGYRSEERRVGRER